MSRGPRLPLWVTAALLVAGLGAAVADRPDDAPAVGSLPRPVQGALPSPEQAMALLEGLAVKGRAPRTGEGHQYRRSAFGAAWTDADRNGCRTRDDVLRRDLAEVVLRDRCTVVAGTVLDPYSNVVLAFSKARAEEVQVDHVVALSDAWQKGAQSWSTQTRLAFANDPLNLLAVSATTNAAKRDHDAASWLPPYKPFRCAFVTRQVAVKAKYRLWVTAAERDAIRRVLGTCPGAAPG